jgi:hypothetical protein
MEESEKGIQNRGMRNSKSVLIFEKFISFWSLHDRSPRGFHSIDMT